MEHFNEFDPIKKLQPIDYKLSKRFIKSSEIFVKTQKMYVFFLKLAKLSIQISNIPLEQNSLLEKRPLMP